MARSRSMSGAAPHSPPVGWDEFVLLDEDDPRELVDGVLVEIEVPGFRHERTVGVLMIRLGAWVEVRNRGVVLPSGYKVRITDRRGVMPDVQFISKEKLPLLDENGLTRGAPDLVVEVISPSSHHYDCVVKRDWYAAVGVAEYWIVDPEARTLERLVLGLDGRYATAAKLGDDAIFEPESFPGLSIALSDLWVDVPVPQRPA